jgi:tetratricopeptide (TPR) repeat protein
MRTRLLVAVLLLSCPSIGEAAPQFPDPAGCANYREIKTGVADSECDAAIASETDPRAKSMMLFRRAYIKDATGNFANYDSAIADLTEAIKLAPDNDAAYHERAYLYNELGRWTDALHDIDRSIELRPTDPKGYQERALTRFMLGDLQGTFRDRDTKFKLQPSDAGALLARAWAELWIGNFDAVKQDVDDADKLIQSGDSASVEFASSIRKELAAWQTRSGASSPPNAACQEADKQKAYDRPGVIGDCSRAFLDAADPKTKAGILTVRAIAWTVALQDEDASTADKQIAVALDPENGGWHSNLGFAYLNAAHSVAAVQEFNRSIKIEPSFYAYAGRAAAYSNLGKYDEAASDAKRSLEMKPNEVALTVLGDIAFEKLKDQKAAAEYWLDAYSLGDRDDGLKARLAKVGVSWPPSPDLLAAPSKPGNPK